MKLADGKGGAKSANSTSSLCIWAMLRRGLPDAIGLA
jgi:hypothetical protein